MAEKDYSQTPLWKKLGLKDGSSLALVDSPKDVTLPVPAEVRVKAGWPARKTDVIVVFATRHADLIPNLRRAKPFLTPAGGLWVAYPKKTSNLSTDLTFENVQRAGLDVGLVDNKSCAIDANWSGVRFVYRLADRPKSPDADKRKPRRPGAKRS